MSDWKEQTLVCSLIMFLCFKLQLTNSLHGLRVGNHSDNPVFPQLPTLSFYNHSSRFYLLQLVLQRQPVSSKSSFPPAPQAHFMVNIHTDFLKPCSLIVNGIFRCLQSWQTCQFGTNKITRITIITIYWILCVSHAPRTYN